MIPGRQDVEMYRLLARKGTLEILSTLSRTSLHYNEIKRLSAIKVSTRTLDARIKELISRKLVDKILMDHGDKKEHLYKLTTAGRALVARAANLDELLSPDNLENATGREMTTILADFTAQTIKSCDNLNKLDNLDFENIWKNILNICNQKKFFYTIAQQKKNEILVASDEGLKIQTDHGTSWIDRAAIREVWVNLLLQGKLSRSDHERTSYRSSFIFTLLMELDCVELESTHPIVIKLKAVD